MRILLTGGSGVISHDVGRHAVACGHTVVAVNRGTHPSRLAAGVRLIVADVQNASDLRAKLEHERFDVVVDFLSYTPDQLTSTFAVCKERCAQFVFISSATAYCRTARGVLKTEDTPVFNPLWAYARLKSECEERLQILCSKGAVRYTIARPYVTYGDTRIPFGLIPQGAQWTLVNRILAGKPVVLWDGGAALCTLTHTTDFAQGLVGLFGNPAALDAAFHITSDERVTWRGVLQTIAQAAGRDPIVADIPSAFIAQHMPETKGMLLGDRATDMVFDNSKIKRAVQGFTCSTDMRSGILRTIAFYRSNPDMLRVNYQWDARQDSMIEAYHGAIGRRPPRTWRLAYASGPSATWHDRLCYWRNRYPSAERLVNVLARLRRREHPCDG